MKIYAATQATHELSEALKKLIFQLNSNIGAPSQAWLNEVINSEGSTLFIAEDNAIIGTLTLVIQKTPTGKKAWIEDVVVDDSARGQGIGARLIKHAINYASESGVQKVDLTSGPGRKAANALYQKLGFIKRDTNVYRLNLAPDDV